MNLGTLVNISDKIDSIDTSESYCDKCYTSETSLLLPYIKLELIAKDVIGNENETLNLEFSYLILDGIKELNWIGENGHGERVVGGYNVTKGQNSDRKDWVTVNQRIGGFEIKVFFEKLMIFVPMESRIGTEWWTPYDTPKFKQNIDSNQVENFFNLKIVPSKLEEELNLKSFKRLTFKSGLNNEIQFVEKNWAK